MCLGSFPNMQEQGSSSTCFRMITHRLADIMLNFKRYSGQMSAVQLYNTIRVWENKNGTVLNCMYCKHSQYL